MTLSRSSKIGTQLWNDSVTRYKELRLVMDAHDCGISVIDVSDA